MVNDTRSLDISIINVDGLSKKIEELSIAINTFCNNNPTINVSSDSFSVIEKAGFNLPILNDYNNKINKVIKELQFMDKNIKQYVNNSLIIDKKISQSIPKEIEE